MRSDAPYVDPVNASFESVEADAEAGDAPRTRLQPIEDALRDGMIVGISHGYQVVVDPTNHASGADALQTANDSIRDNGSTDFGIVYFPPVGPDGTELVIDKTVVFGDRSSSFAAVPRGWGFRGQYAPMLNCTINDGSPMFVLASNSNNGGMMQLNSTWFGGFAADASGNDAGFLHLESVVSFALLDCLAVEFDCPTADGVFVIDGSTFNSYINRCSYAAISNSVADADVWVVQNSLGDSTSSTAGPPGEIKWGPGNSTYADPSYPFNHCYLQTVDASSMVFGGRFEGNGNNKVHVTSGKLTLPATFEGGRNQSSTAVHDVYFSGSRLTVGAADIESNGTGGDNIHIADANQLYIGAFRDQRMDNQSGDAIHLEKDGGGSNIYEVPREESLNGTVTYPPTPWSATRYPDGWQKYRTGTDTISAGSEVLLNDYLRDNQEVRVDWTITTDPAADVRVEEHVGWSTATGQQAAWLEETTGAGSVDVDWTVELRP